jgi:glycosyltransferase involved in cell wall biosynthesis
LNIDKIQKKEREFWVTYAGTLGTSYDIGTLLRAGGALREKGYTDIKIVILGNGPLREHFERIAKESNCNVDFVGYVPYDLMAAYLKKSDILINSFVRKAPQSIVNKIGDYLAAGKPVINTCSDKEFRALVTEKDFGVNVIAEDVDKLMVSIENLHNNADEMNRMAINARKTAEAEFDRKVSYLKIVELFNSLLN